MGVMHFIEASSGAKLALHDLGGGGPKTLLILHANGFCGRAYLPLARALHEQFHCYALDMRGHGDSAHTALHPVAGAGMGLNAVRLPPTALLQQTDCLVEDVYAAVRFLKGEVHLFGHSLGGMLALVAEARRPGTFVSMYVFEPNVGEWHSSPQRVPELLSSMAMRRRARFDSKAAAVASWVTKVPFSSFDAEALQLYAEHGLRSLPEGGATLACEAPTAEAWMYLLVEPLMAEAFERLPSIGCAVTIACGGGGQPTDFLHEIAPAAAARLPKGRLKRFDGLHHFGPLERPWLVAEDLLAFFHECGAASEHNHTAASVGPRAKL